MSASDLYFTLYILFNVFCTFWGISSQQLCIYGRICFQTMFITLYHCRVSADVTRCVSFLLLNWQNMWLSHSIVSWELNRDNWNESFPVNYVDMEGQYLRRSVAWFFLINIPRPCLFHWCALADISRNYITCVCYPNWTKALKYILFYL